MRLADEYAKRYGKRPTRMSEIVQAGLLRGIPGDPLGFAYIFGEGRKSGAQSGQSAPRTQLLLDRFK